MHIILICALFLSTFSTILSLDNILEAERSIRVNRLPKVCPLNEIPTKCFNECGRHCDDGMKMACSPKCSEFYRCTCMNGFLRDRKSSKCVLRKECPIDHINEPNDIHNGINKKCGLNEEFKECGTCDSTCEINFKICSIECEPTCNCITGYSRDTMGVCIDSRYC